MLIGRISNDKTNQGAVLMLLEPANIAGIQTGKGIVKSLNDVIPELPIKLDIMIVFTPDMLFVAEQLTKGKPLMETVEASLTRPEVYDRPHHETKEFKGERDS
jgi:hypothetical protein